MRELLLSCEDEVAIQVWTSHASVNAKSYCSTRLLFDVCCAEPYRMLSKLMWCRDISKEGSRPPRFSVSGLQIWDGSESAADSQHVGLATWVRGGRDKESSQHYQSMFNHDKQTHAPLANYRALSLERVPSAC